MRSIWDTDGGVYFGHQCAAPADADQPLAGDWTARPELHRYTGDRHLITIGPNGSGKTRRLLVPNLATLLNWSILVVDPKGELAVQTAAHRKAAGSEIVTLDPFGVIERQYPGLVEAQPYLKSAGLNPIAALDPDGEDFPDDAKVMGEALVKVESKNEAYWAKSAQTLLTGLIMGLRVKVGPAADLGILREFIGAAPDELAAIITQKILPDLPEHHHAIRAKLSRFTKIDTDNRELMSILSTAQTHTDWLDSAPIQRDLSGAGRFDFAAMKERPVTVYLVLPPRYLETHATWLRLMIAAVLLPLIRSTGGKVPVLFMLDEFAQLGRLEVIEQNMALMRGYGLKLWPVFQDLAQAQDIYEKRWESFISNAGVLQSFAPQDVTTREYLSKLSGQRLYWLKTVGTNTGQSMGPQSSTSSGVTEGWSNMQGPVYWPQALASMKDGQAVLFAKGRAPRSWLPDPSEIEFTRNMLAAADNAAAKGRAQAL
jgi:type IV secretion system protein VirD4